MPGRLAVRRPRCLALLPPHGPSEELVGPPADLRALTQHQMSATLQHLLVHADGVGWIIGARREQDQRRGALGIAKRNSITLGAPAEAPATTHRLISR